MNEETDRQAAADAIDAQFTTARSKTFAEGAAATSDYIIVAAYRRYVDDQLASGEVTISGGRLMTRYVGLTEANVNVMRSRTRTALEDKILTGDVGPFVFESGDVATPDDGWIVATDFWTY